MPRFSRPLLKISTRTLEGAVHVVLHGEIDIATTPVLVDRLELVETRDPPLLVVDLGGVTFIDGAGLTALLGAARRATNAGRRFQIARASGSIRRLLELTAIDQSLELAR